MDCAFFCASHPRAQKNAQRLVLCSLVSVPSPERCAVEYNGCMAGEAIVSPSTRDRRPCLLQPRTGASSMPETTTDILVIGGVIGSAIAYHLARAGYATLVLEQSALASPPAASWASAGGIRRQGRGATSWPKVLG
jgi:hypothetical protein